MWGGVNCSSKVYCLRCETLNLKNFHSNMAHEAYVVMIEILAGELWKRFTIPFSGIPPSLDMDETFLV